MRNIFDLHYIEDGEASFMGAVFLRDSVPVPEYDWDLVLEPLIGSCI